MSSSSGASPSPMLNLNGQQQSLAAAAAPLLQLFSQNFNAAIAQQAVLAKENTAGGILSCPDCSFSATTARRLQKHRAKQHGDGKFSCEFCDFTSAYQSNLYRHLKQYHAIKKDSYPCSKGQGCNYVAKTAEGLKVHTSQVHPEQHMCAECGDVLNTKSQYQEHLRVCHNVSAAGAKLCESPKRTASAASGGGWSSADDSILAASETYGEHSPATALQIKYSRKYQCNRCSFITREASDYLHHLRDEHGEQMHISYCHLCSYASKTLAKVKRHQELIHGIKPARGPLFPPGATGGVIAEQFNGVDQQDDDADDDSDDEDELRLMIDERATSATELNNSNGMNGCTKCEFTATTGLGWVQHQAAHGARSKFLCLRCDFSEGSIQAMLHHCAKHHTVQKRSVATQSDESWGDLEAHGVTAAVDVDAVATSSEASAAMGGSSARFRLNPTWGGPEMGAELVTTAATMVSSSPATMVEPVSATKLSSSPGGFRYASPRSAAGKGSAQTLDQLVALKASPNADFSQIYMTEEEAIETPNQEEDMEIMSTVPTSANDLDVSSRTCPICGYQGKWISEMIRHKRVHTNQRPFKCKKCNRTSKWKADLIRHVAKAHGIRVVSKYSRNKSLEATDVAIMRNTLKQATMNGSTNGTSTPGTSSTNHSDTDRRGSVGEYHRNTPQSIKSEVVFGGGSSSSVTKRTPVTSALSIKVPGGGRTVAESSKVTWKCAQCAFEQESRGLLFDHLYNVHCLTPYACGRCEFKGSDRSAAVAHCRGQHADVQCLVEHALAVAATTSSLLPPTTTTSAVKRPLADSDSYSDNSDHSTNIAQPPTAKRERVEQKPSSDNSSTVSSLTTTAPESPFSVGRQSPSAGSLACPLCPNIAADRSAANLHAKAHQRPTGLINYKCHFCDWYNKKKQAIEEHMALHTDEPAKYMQEVERNLITPMSFVGEKQPTSSSTSIVEQTKSPSVAKITHTELKHMPSSLLSSSQQLQLETSDEMDGEDSGDANDDGGTSGGSSSGEEKEDRLAYLHAGFDWCRDGFIFARVVPPKIQKVCVGADSFRKMWQCRYCSHRSKRRANVRMHEKTHFKPLTSGEFRCPDCQHFRGTRQQLNEHYRANHLTVEQKQTVDQLQLQKCDKCPARFKSDADLELHAAYHGAIDLALRCVQCNYATSTQEELKFHSKVHTVIEPITSSVRTSSLTASESCPQLYAQQQLSMPLPVASPKQPPAVEHNNNFGNAAANFSSIFPDLQRTSSDILMQYLQKMFEQNPAAAAAAQLVAAATVASSLPSSTSASMVQVQPTAPLRTTTTAAASAKSTPSSSPATPALPKPKRYRCDKCDAKFTDNTQLKRHVGFHGVHLAHNCPLCDYSVPFPINLVKHLRSHHGLQITHMTEVDELNKQQRRIKEEEQQQQAEMAAKQQPPTEDNGELLLKQEDEEEEDEARVTPADDGSLKIRISLGKRKTPSPPQKSVESVAT